VSIKNQKKWCLVVIKEACLVVSKGRV
jgi:hypothetical protein